MSDIKRIFLIVLDSVGIGALPDAADFGDSAANTMLSISKSKEFKINNLKSLGIGNIEGLSYLGAVNNPTAAVGKMAEKSAGKDTTTGHWEIAGLISEQAMPTYPNGFPKEILDEFSFLTDRGVLCNKPYSGTRVIVDYGEEHLKTGNLIVYTSADSVFQIAAHEDIVPVNTLYEYCRQARGILKGEHAVGRVIARPFKGEYPNFVRTENRHDFSVEPFSDTMLDAIKSSGLDVIAVGKISDIFAGKGITKSIFTHNNREGMQTALTLLESDFNGLCFINLVDFDMVYGHRNDVNGYAKALSEFDLWLPKFTDKMQSGDVLIITADHGCDPATEGTDHTREHTPLIVYGQNIKPVNLGVRSSFADIAATVTEIFNVEYKNHGKSFMGEITKGVGCL